MSRPTRCNGCQILVRAVAVAIVASLLPVNSIAADGGVQEAGTNGMVQLTFPEDVELKTLVDYVSERLGINILYDEQVAGKRVSIKSPEQIPVDSLLELLQSALRMKGMLLVDVEPAGWKRVVQTTRLGELARAEDPEAALEAHGFGTAVTQVFVLEHADPQQVNQVIREFLTQPGANSNALQEQQVLIVTDHAENVLKISRLIELIDRPKAQVATEFVPVRHTQASVMAQQLSQLLAARSRARGGPGRPEVGVEVAHDDRTNQLMLVGLRDEIDDVLQYVDTLDVPLGLETEVYPVRFVSAERIDRLVKDLIDSVMVDRLYRSVVDRDENLLLATTTGEIHNQIQLLIERLDVPGEEARERSPIQFYKLENVTVTELLETLRGLDGRVEPRDRRLPHDGRIRPFIERAVPGPNRPPGDPRQRILPLPPAFREENEQGQGAGNENPQNGLSQVGLEMPAAGLVPGDVQLIPDPNTNTLIVVGDPEVQRMYRELIEALDRRRPQVLIEARVVIIDTSDDFTLGVEVSGGDRKGVKRLFSFSSFGLSNVDPVTGALAIIPGLGFNGTLVDPDVADAVLRALTTHRRARIVASPRVLVNDNATGILASVAEVPFTSINASQVVATTSFAGFAEAGTTIVVTPHISEGDHLQLSYTITLNSFTGPAAEGIPPPRQTDEVDSEVTVPDGHTVIVGGLSRTMTSRDIDAIPFLEKIPVLKYLARIERNSSQESSLFVFLRPIILREDKFEDLKFLSRRDVHRAKLPADFPTSKPLVID